MVDDHAATHCNTLQHAATRCNALHHVAPYCDTLHHTATRYIPFPELLVDLVDDDAATHCKILQRTTSNCNVLQRTATHIHARRSNLNNCTIWLIYIAVSCKGWLRLVGALKLQVSIGKYSLFYRALLQKRPIILRRVLIVATP